MVPIIGVWGFVVSIMDVVEEPDAETDIEVITCWITEDHHELEQSEILNKKPFHHFS